MYNGFEAAPVRIVLILFDCLERNVVEGSVQSFQAKHPFVFLQFMGLLANFLRVAEVLRYDALKDPELLIFQLCSFVTFQFGLYQLTKFNLLTESGTRRSASISEYYFLSLHIDLLVTLLC